MPDPISIPQCVAIQHDLLAEQDDGSLEACAIERTIYLLRWIEEKLKPIAVVLPQLLAHPEATRKFGRGLDEAEQAPESALVRETFPGAEITGLTDPDADPQQNNPDEDMTHAY